MKKFNCNMMVFVFACVFVITSIWGDCFCGAVQTGMDLGHFIKKGDFSYADTCKNRLEKNTLKKQRKSQIHRRSNFYSDQINI